MNILKHRKYLVVNLSCFLLTVWLITSCQKKSPNTKAKFGTITESVYGSARIKAENQFTIYPSLNGSLLKIYVNAGDSITKDKLLFELDNETSSLNSDNAKLALELSEENIKVGSEKIRELEINLKLSKEKYELDLDLLKRQKNLWAQGVGSQTELDQKELSLQNSKSNYEASKSRLLQIKTQLKNDLGKAQNNYKISTRQRKDFLVKSIMKGRVFDVFKKEGEIVGPQTPLAIIGSAEKFIIEMDIDQTDIIRVKLNQEISVLLDSYKGKVFRARVSKIYPIMNEKSRTFKVEALFEDNPSLLFPNLTAEANILIQKKENVLTIPRNYLIDNKFVNLGGDKRAEVKTGLSDYQKIEIINGLDSSTIIYEP
jgi:multidrug efflux pump subunit AcrA (membrane-fusion protein)